MTATTSVEKASKPEGETRSERTHRAILEAATEVFLRDGYLGASMDEIATLSAVSKQTVYKHFTSKEALFVEIVNSMTSEAGDAVHNEKTEIGSGVKLEDYLRNYAYRQLEVVLTPRLMQLRRLVISEVGRFPELAKVLYERGPQRALTALATSFESLAQRDLLVVDDPMVAATQFNWLVMAEPLNRAMLLGDESIPTQEELRRHAEEGVRVFLAAYGKQ